jgi:peptide/nickel transport system permease protein
MKQIKQTFRELLRYPSAVLGLAIILLLLLVSVYTVIKIPYSEAIRLWRGGEEVWYKNPKYAAPEWTNLFRKNKLAKTFTLSSAEGTASKEVTQSQGVTTVNITFAFDYQYDTFPQEMSLYFKSEYSKKQPNISLSWVTPAGKVIQVASSSVAKSQTYRFSQDTKLARKLAGLNPQEGLFVLDPKAEKLAPVRGKYELRVSGLLFEETGNLDAEFVLYGQVAGWAGTDHNRRDLGIALLWGTPIALSFGLLAALGTTVLTMIIAAFGVWFGGWVDELIQRITEVNAVLPFLPIMIMIGTFYSRSIWVILGGAIALSIFSLGIKQYRATFLQIKEMGYIEAARSYGASSIRIIFMYLVPRMIPLIIPALVIGIPVYVFLEASLAVLGLGDPVLPTWGKMIYDAQSNGALYKGLYYWVLEPSALLMIAGLAFAFLGFSLDRIFNPRLRGM